MQEFAARATETMCGRLVGGIDRLSDEQRRLRIKDKSRTALDQAAECVLINEGAAEILQRRKADFPPDFMAQFEGQKNRLVEGGWPEIRRRLEASLPPLVAAMRATPNDALELAIEMPWRTEPLWEIMQYPAFNMTYHLGMINMVATMEEVPYEGF